MANPEPVMEEMLEERLKDSGSEDSVKAAKTYVTDRLNMILAFLSAVPRRADCDYDAVQDRVAGTLQRLKHPRPEAPLINL